MLIENREKKKGFKASHNSANFTREKVSAGIDLSTGSFVSLVLRGGGVGVEWKNQSRKYHHDCMHVRKKVAITTLCTL